MLFHLLLLVRSLRKFISVRLLFYGDSSIILSVYEIELAEFIVISFFAFAALTLFILSPFIGIMTKIFVLLAISFHSGGLWHGQQGQIIFRLEHD